MAFRKQFKDKSKKNKKIEGFTHPQQFTRVRLPRGKEILGVIEQRYGGAKMAVKCADGKTRNCRVPGRLRRRLWTREGDIILIEPWEFDNDRGDVLFKYNPSQVQWLKRQGHLKNIVDEF